MTIQRRISALSRFNQSTPERRSALLLGEGSQPVTFILWQEVAAQSAARLLLSINVRMIQLSADYSQVARVVNLLLE
jgi:hypothetical protein